MVQAREPEPSRVGDERNFFLGLLRLQEHVDTPERLLQEALEHLVSAVGARHGFIELEETGEPNPLSWHAAKGYSEDDLAQVRRSLSRGIVAEAIARGERIHTASAMDDPRFSDLESVRSSGIRAVLCAPIRAKDPLGVVYLEGAQQSGPFDDHAQWLLEMFVRSLGPIAERVLVEARAQRDEDVAYLLPCPGLVARSPAMRTVLEKLRSFASLEIALLLTGDTGVGKSMLARALHANSKRASRPFIEVNCAAIPDSLLENELFGSAPGGHSNAPPRGHEGRIGAAEGGTLLLDEIGDLSANAQAKLLQFLQSRTYFRLGESKPRRADIRVIVATNTDLQDLVRQKTFREDLFYRLQILQVRLPGLRERPEDVLPMAREFLRAASQKHELGELELSPATETALEMANWPGNVRQLEHAIEAAAVNAAAGLSRLVQPRHVFPSAEGPGTVANGDELESLQSQLHAVRARIVKSALRRTGWNVSETARRLDIARSYLYKLVEAHDLHRDD